MMQKINHLITNHLNILRQDKTEMNYLNTDL